MRKRICAAVLLSVGVAAIAHATFRTGGWSYSVLTKKAKLIVIARPTKVQESGEVAKLPNSQNVKIIGMETTFSVCAVLKGKWSQEKLILRHYKLQEDWQGLSNSDSKVLMDSATKPLFVKFDPKAEDEYPKYDYLLFLKMGKDGRFVPVSDQVNATISVKRLPGLANYK